MKKIIAFAVAAFTTTAIAITTVSAPAFAGDRERRVATGVVLGVIGGALIANEIHRNHERRRYHSDDYYPEVSRRHRHRGEGRRYVEREPIYVERRYREPIYVERRVEAAPRQSRWERHVEACYDAYKTYDERSDTYISRNARERRCDL